MSRFAELAKREALTEADCGCWRGRGPRCARCEDPLQCVLCGDIIEVGAEYHEWDNDAMHLRCILAAEEDR